MGRYSRRNAILFGGSSSRRSLARITSPPMPRASTLEALTRVDGGLQAQLPVRL